MGTTLLPHLPNQARPRRAATRRRLRLTVVSTYPPRRCGLASYTTDLRDALAVAAPGWRVEVCAVDRDGLAYGPQVPVVIRQDDPEDYRRAADAIADRGCDLVLIQHEYGIFGGPDGVYVTNLAARLRERGVPYAVTLHTVLAEPSPGQAGVLRDLCGQAAGVTVFTDTARRLVAGRFADPRSVAVVPHGAPEVLRAPV
ncbi:MAG: glycosyltransferase, partial [Dactylosporangium sp.]|nr:glycosyltransferase [Dactylosporangium sp.]